MEHIVLHCRIGIVRIVYRSMDAINSMLDPTLIYTNMFSGPTTHTYLLSGSNLSMRSILFSYIVNTIPPLNINLTNLGSAPLQKVKIPSFFAIRAAQAVLVETPGFYALHSSFNSVKRLGNVNSNKASNTPNSKRGDGTQFLSWSCV
jgi:hypothetical protein